MREHDPETALRNLTVTARDRQEVNDTILTRK